MLSSSGSADEVASSTRLIEDGVVLLSCCVFFSHRCSKLGMNTPGNTGSVVWAERDAGKGTTERETINIRDGIACNDDRMPSDDTGNPATTQTNTAQTTQETDGKDVSGDASSTFISTNLFIFMV